jgi:aryl-alcohol dehydrogenase-like predicted oxidoreductase
MAGIPKRSFGNTNDQVSALGLGGHHLGDAFDNDPELFIRSGGAAEALEKAKQQGKVRYVGFTGHKSPALHLKMLATDLPGRKDVAPLTDRQ